MKSDMEMIKCVLPRTMDEIHIYGLADWHIGSKECDTEFIKKTIKVILDDPCGFAVIAGDLLDNGLKNSKTDCYSAILNPHEQLEACYEYLLPLAEAGKILCATDGNHEYRSVRETSVSPLYTIMCRLPGHLEDVFRPYMCLLDLKFGECGFGRAGSYNTYYGLVTHGSSRNKHRKFEVGAFDGLDFCVSGHTHQPEYASRGKIRIDSRGVAKHVNFKSLIVCPALQFGGYAIQKEYEPTGTGEIQYLSLKKIRADKTKRMEFHTIQI